MIENRKHQVLRPIFQDFGLLNVSLLLTYMLLNRWLSPNAFPLGAYLLTSTVGSITILLLGLAVVDQQPEEAPRDFPAEMDEVARTLLVGVGTLILCVYLVFGLHLEPSVVGMVLSVSVLSLLTSRLVLRYQASEPARRRLLVIGSHGQAVSDLLENFPDSGYQLIGIVEERSGEAVALAATAPFWGGTRILNLLNTSDVIVAAPGHLESLQRTLPGNARLMHTPALYESVAGKLPVRLIPDTHFQDILAYRHSTWFDVCNRAFDLLSVMIAFPFAAVISLVIIPLIKWESPGPALYSQERVGLDGKTFRIFKFRSMVLNAESNGAQWAQQDDPRVTRIGKFIRQTRIDELPQFLNVLWGDMSLIGPRPERPEFVAELAEQLPYFNNRQLVKPGITGWAQVQYGYGSSLYDSLEKLQYDLYYIKHRTNPLLTLQIIFKTVAVVITRRGAR